MTATPRRVRGVVTRHEPYGFYLDFGDPQPGLVVITMVSDDPRAANPPFPAIGAEIDAMLLGYTAVDGQPRLSVRESDVAASKDDG